MNQVNTTMKTIHWFCSEKGIILQLSLPNEMFYSHHQDGVLMFSFLLASAFATPTIVSNHVPPASGTYMFQWVNDANVPFTKYTFGGTLVNQEFSSFYAANRKIQTQQTLSQFIMNGQYSWNDIQFGVQLPLVLDTEHNRAALGVASGQKMGDLSWNAMIPLKKSNKEGWGASVLVRHTLPSSQLAAPIGIEHHLVSAEAVLSSSVPMEKQWFWSTNIGLEKQVLATEANSNYAAKLYARGGVGYAFAQSTGLSLETWSALPITAEDVVNDTTTEMAISAFHQFHDVRFRASATMSLGESVDSLSGRTSIGFVYAPQVNIYDRDEDGLADEVDACPLEPEDEDGIDDFDGCPDHPLVTIQLVDQNGAAIENQEFLLAGKRGFSGVPMEIPAGMWNVRIDSRYITNASQELEVPNTEKITLSVPVKQPYQDVSVDIRNKNGKRLKNISWGLVHANNMHTNKNGALPVGEQFVRLSADGYRSVIQKLNVDPNGKSSISVRLKKSKVRKKGSRLVLSQSVVFKDKKTAELEIRSYSILNDVADLMLSHPELDFTIETHTDSVGSSKSNLSFTQKQGDVIKRYLMDNDIQSNRLLVLARGEKNPIANNMYKSGRKKNRRVEFRVQKNEIASR
ncbi:MAG: hypothetical protein CL916_14105 [Deltaproteobacteria bacterium]|nr:hypothetical protein [Deltaproteobacteria bacterium]